MSGRWVLLTALLIVWFCINYSADRAVLQDMNCDLAFEKEAHFPYWRDCSTILLQESSKSLWYLEVLKNLWLQHCSSYYSHRKSSDVPVPFVPLKTVSRGIILQLVYHLNLSHKGNWITSSCNPLLFLKNKFESFVLKKETYEHWWAVHI